MLSPLQRAFFIESKIVSTVSSACFCVSCRLATRMAMRSLFSMGVSRTPGGLVHQKPTTNENVTRGQGGRASAVKAVRQATIDYIPRRQGRTGRLRGASCAPRLERGGGRRGSERWLRRGSVSLEPRRLMQPGQEIRQRLLQDLRRSSLGTLPGQSDVLDCLYSLE